MISELHRVPRASTGGRYDNRARRLSDDKDSIAINSDKGKLLLGVHSAAIAASFATVFMLRAVPSPAAGMRNLERPIPSG